MPNVMSSSGLRSPLALLVLALLCEHPMHVYGLHKLIRERGQDTLVNVEHRNSVRQAVERLIREGRAEVDEVQSGAGPQRTVYRVTEQGRGDLQGWLRDLLSAPRREFPVFPVAVSLLSFLSPEEAAELLKLRRGVLQGAHSDLDARNREAATHLPTIFLVEVDLQLRLLEAEIGWVDTTLTRITSGDLTWDTAALLENTTMRHTLTEDEP